MDKIKKAFGSGSQDDDIMYGTPTKSSDQPSSLQTDTNTAAADKDTLGTQGSVLNTGNEKPSEQSYGTSTQATEIPQRSSEPVSDFQRSTEPTTEDVHRPTEPVTEGVSRSTEPTTEDVHRPTEPMTETTHQPSDSATKTAEAEQGSNKKGILGRIFGSSDKKDAEERTEADPSSTKEFTNAPPDPSKVYRATDGQPQDDSHLGRDAAIGGAAATGIAGATYAATRGDDNDGERGLVREDRGDDVSQATYTARSYPLTSSAAHTSTPREPQVDSSLDRREPEDHSSGVRDTSLAGAGTLIGAGAVGAGALASQEDKHPDPEVDQATYTDRAYPVGSSSGTHEGIAQPQSVDSGSQQAGHMPGEYPTETGEDPHVPGQFPADTTEEDKSGLGSGAGVASAAGLGVGGAAAGGAYAASKSHDTTATGAVPSATGSDRHPGGSGFPHESTQPTTSTSESHLGRDTAIGGGVAAGAGGLAYAATRGDDKHAETAPTQTLEDTTAAPTSSSTAPISHTTETTPAPTTSRTIDGKPKEDESHLGRDAAIAGGVAAGAGGLGYAATRGDDKHAETAPTQRFEDNTSAPTSSTAAPISHTAETTPAATTSRTIDEKHTPAAATATEDKPKEDESHLGRDAAIGGGAAAAAGGAAYYATRDDHPEQSTEEKKGFMDKLKEKKQERDQKKEEEKAEKERQKEQERLEKERQKENEKPEESHVGRDAAIAGTGAAAAGGAAYYATRDDDAEKAAKEREEADKQRVKDQEKADKERAKEQEKAEKERQKEHENAEKERQKEHERAEKEREKQQKEAEKEREKDQKKHEKELTKEEKKEEERRKREAWEKENAARLAAYQRGELGPEDVIRDGQAPHSFADRSTEEAVAGGVVGAGVVGGGAAAYEANKSHEHPTASSSEHHTATDDHGHSVLHKDKKYSEDSGHSSEKKPSLIQKILHPNKSRQASQEHDARSSQEATRPSQEFTPHKGHVGTDGPIGDPNQVSGLESGHSNSRDVAGATTGATTGAATSAATSSTARGTGDEIQPAASSSGGQRMETLAPGEQAPEGYITLVHAGADPDAPHAVIRG